MLAADDASSLKAWLKDKFSNLPRPSGSWIIWTIVDPESRFETGLLIAASQSGACKCLLLLASFAFDKGLWSSVGSANHASREATATEKEWLRASAISAIGALSMLVRVEGDAQRKHDLEQTLHTFTTSFLRKDQREALEAAAALRGMWLADKRWVEEAIADAATADEGERIGDGIRVPPSSGKGRGL